MCICVYACTRVGVCVSVCGGSEEGRKKVQKEKKNLRRKKY